VVGDTEARLNTVRCAQSVVLVEAETGIDRKFAQFDRNSSTP